jgi:hypothetical protein
VCSRSMSARRRTAAGSWPHGTPERVQAWNFITLELLAASVSSAQASWSSKLWAVGCWLA